MPASYKRSILAVLIGVLVGFSAAAQDLTIMPTSITSARTSGMGGPNAALADGLSTLFSNPAGFYAATPQIRFSEIALHLQGPIFDIAGIIAGSGGGNFASVLSSPSVQNLLQSIYASMGLVGPISFGYVGKGIGLGLFGGSTFTLENTAPFTVAAAIGQQLMLNGGYAFRIPLPASWNSSLDAGIMLKGGLQGVSYIEKSLFELPSVLGSLGMSTLTSAPFYFNTVIGVDAGLRYSFGKILSVGLVGHNLYTPVFQSLYPTMKDFLTNSATPANSTKVLPVDVAVGAVYSPKLTALQPVLTNVKFLLDYNHALGFLLYPATARNPLLNIGIGTEVTLLRILKLRAGFYEGLFAAGLGVDLHYFTLNAAMFGSELSTQPGQQSVFNMIVGFGFQV